VGDNTSTNDTLSYVVEKHLFDKESLEWDAKQ
jgi:hypothetical protein